MSVALRCPTPALVREVCPTLAAGKSDDELDEIARRAYAIARVVWENAGLLPRADASRPTVTP